MRAGADGGGRGCVGACGKAGRGGEMWRCWEWVSFGEVAGAAEGGWELGSGRGVSVQQDGGRGVASGFYGRSGCAGDSGMGFCATAMSRAIVGDTAAV